MKDWNVRMNRAAYPAPRRRDFKRFARWVAERYFSMSAPRPLWTVRKRPGMK